MLCNMGKSASLFRSQFVLFNNKNVTYKSEIIECSRSIHHTNKYYSGYN